MNLYTELIKETLKTSKFETKRDYISLSNIVKPVDELLSDYYNGYSADESAQIKCRLGYYMEAGLKERLLKIPYIKDSFEIIVPESNNLIKGHTDFTFYNQPGDCKSFAMDSYMPINGKVSKKIFWQMNAYMLYMDESNSFIVSESRESGFISVIEIRRNENICNQIKEKVNIILKELM